MTHHELRTKKEFFASFVDAVNIRKLNGGRAAYRCFSFLWRFGETSIWFRLLGERIVEFSFAPGIDRIWDFSLSAPDEVWVKHFAREQQSPYHHLFGLWARIPDFQLDGDRETVAQHAVFINELMRVARSVWLGDEPSARDNISYSYADDIILGSYRHVKVGGDTCRIYTESSGTGADLLCLHTAGADSRQYYHLLNDRDLASHWRMTAFDMPGHGKSFLPPGSERQEYRLTMARYVETLLSFVERMALKRPVVVGCSMAGAICLELARSHPEKFAGVIACEAADRIPGRLNEWLRHPRVDSAEFAPQWIDGLIAPTTPPHYRQEILWQYSQAGADIFFGDVAFYSGEFKVSEDDTFRTDLCPVYMLTGEFDYSCTPEMSRNTALKIPGATFTEMKDLGHFPMSENPEKFMLYLRPILDQLLQRQ